MSENITNNNIPTSLRDIVTSADTSSVFYRYREHEYIGKNIFKELYKRFVTVGGRQGFCMGDDSKEIGILSQCQSLQSLLLLASEFKLTFDDRHLISPTKENKTIREIMDIVVEDIINQIKTDRSGVYVFDASPYETNLFTAQYSNVDAITWVIPTFLLVLGYHARIGEICKWEDELVSVITYGIKYINDSFIDPTEEGKDSDKLLCGWNFTKDCQEPSLYYTFAVCECFVDFYETFKDYLEYREAVRNHKRFPNIAVPQSLVEAYDQHQKDREEQMKREHPGYIDEENKLRERARFDEYNELVRLYTKINNGVATIHDSIYGELEQKCKKVSKEVWRLVKGGFADHFYYNDLHTTITEDEIRMSTTSDALFNSVYIINILIDAGIDEEFRLEEAAAGSDTEKAEFFRREYNELFEICQLASQKAFRCYENLKKDAREYIVDQFLIGFNESFTVHKDLIKELRKRRMRVFSLVPLLVHTNNVISDYLVRYPQHNMKKYLGYILDNRLVEDGKVRWIWENDGFFSASNYYYVSALGEFYSYYTDYESSYINIAQDNEKTVKAIQDDFKREMEKSGDIFTLNKTISKQQEQIADLEQQLKNKSTPVEDAVAIVVQREMERLLPDMLCQVVEQMAVDIKTMAFESKSTDRAKNHPFSAALGELLLAMVCDKILANTHSGNKTAEQNTAAFNQLCMNVRKEVNRCVGTFISQVNDTEQNRSTLFSSDDD